jgi:2-methylcitrate dehydratase PrpD
MTLVHTLAEFAVEARDGKLPDDVARDVPGRVRDIVGLALAAHDSEPARIVGGVVRRWAGRDEAAVIGTPLHVPAATAALVNGTLAHALDFDDTHLPSVLHPSASVVPAALAVADATHASGSALAAAVAVGDEITVRLGMAGYDRELGNSVFFEKGLHATSICGTVGSAAAAALLLGLDADRVAHAMGIAASMGAGLLEANRTGGTVKRIHCGWAAHGGVTAAELAAGGLTGPPTVLEGRFGFLQAFCDEHVDLSALTDALGESWEVPGLFYKPYPANHFTHAGIDAALQLRSRGVAPDDVDEVVLGVAAPTLRTIAQPEAEKAAPATGYGAQFSGPFTFATAMCGGGGLGVYLDDFTDDAVRDERRRALAAKVRCVADDECDGIYPFQFPAVVYVRLRDGREEQVKVLANRGGPDNPLSRQELAEKFRLNAARTLGADAVARLDGVLAEMGDLDDVADLTRAAQLP